MASELAPVRAVQHFGSWVLLGTIGLLVVTGNFIPAAFAAIGVALSTFLKSRESSVPVTKRRALATVWNHMGAYAAGMGILCGLTMVGILLIFHTFAFWPIVFFTVATCWLPFFIGLMKRKG